MGYTFIFTLIQRQDNENAITHGEPEISQLGMCIVALDEMKSHGISLQGPEN
jgi:hypothetical protein